MAIWALCIFTGKLSRVLSVWFIFGLVWFDEKLMDKTFSNSCVEGLVLGAWCKLRSERLCCAYSDRFQTQYDTLNIDSRRSAYQLRIRDVFIRLPTGKNPFPSWDIIASFRIAWLPVSTLSSDGHQDTFRRYLDFYYILVGLPWCHTRFTVTVHQNHCHFFLNFNFF